MTHPAEFLTEGRGLTPDQWGGLRQECSESWEGPGEDETTFLFLADYILDSYDRTIVANEADDTFRCLPQPHCVCRRGALECQCRESRCNECGGEFVAMTSVCDATFCVNDHCPLCEHQRETCLYRSVLDSVREQAERNRRQFRDCVAASHVGAVGDALAPGVGDAPLFPATVRLLDELLGAGQGIQDPAGTRVEGLEWDCRDGSRVRHDPNNPGWLTWDDPGKARAGEVEE